MTGDYDAKSVCIVAELSDIVVITKVKREKHFNRCEK